MAALASSTGGLWLPAHGLSSIYYRGRVYPHIPSPIKKRGSDDQCLLRIHRAQWGPFRSKKRFRVVVAGRRWGKTHWVVIELLIAARAGPKQRVWYIAPTYTMAKQIAWEKLKEIMPLSWIKKGPAGPMINETSLTITLTNDSKISLKGADRPDTLRGIGLNFIALDEYQDFKPRVWEAVLRPTLSDTRGKAIFIGTPKSFNHLYDMYVKGQKKPNGTHNPYWDSWQFKTSDSPFIPLSEIEMAKDDMDIRTFKQEYEASFETMGGRVYYDFDRFKNVRPCPYDPSMPLLVGQDFNIDPMSSVFLQQRGDELWGVGELSLRSASSEDVCREIIKEYGWGVLDKAIVYPDPSGGNRTGPRGDSDIQIFREWKFERILHHRKAPHVRDRISAVNRLICDAKLRRRLYLDPSMKETIKCLEQLIYKEGTNDPDKSLNIEHSGDALGYPVEYEYPVKRPFGSVGYSH